MAFVSKLVPRSDAGLATLIACLTILVYLPALRNQWIWDDDDYVTENECLQTPQGLYDIWTNPESTPQYYPVVFSTFWSLHQGFGLWPFPYHLLNVLGHAANAAILYRILRSLDLRASFWIAIMFGIHPINVESVAWVTEFKNIGSGFFYGLSWIALWPVLVQDHQVVAAPGKSGAKLGTQRFPWLRYTIALVAFAAALLCKSVTATFGFAILLVLWFRIGRIRLRDVGYLVPFMLVGIALGWNTARLEVEHVGASGMDWSYGFVDRIGIAARCVEHYALNIVLPTEQMFFYPRFSTDFGWQAFVALTLCVVLISGFVYAAYRGQRGALAGALFFGGSAFPALGFLNVYPHRFSFVADHFVYIPMIGILAVFVSFLYETVQRLKKAMQTEKQKSYLADAALPTFALLLVFHTLRYIPAYENEVKLWEDTLSKNSDCPAAWHNLAHAYLDSGDVGYAKRAIDQALTYDFDRFHLLNTLGLVENALGYPQLAEKAFRESLLLEPNYANCILNLAKIVHERAKATSETDQARALWQESQSLFERAYKVLPSFRTSFLRAVAEGDRGDFATAAHWFEIALQHSPADATARFNLAVCYEKLKNYPRAMEILAQYRRDFPNDEKAEELLSQWQSLAAQ